MYYVVTAETADMAEEIALTLYGLFKIKDAFVPNLKKYIKSSLVAPLEKFETIYGSADGDFEIYCTDFYDIPDYIVYPGEISERFKVEDINLTLRIVPDTINIELYRTKSEPIDAITIHY